MRSILYLGLHPPANAIHYPVIRTEKILGKELEEAIRLWPDFTHVMFTSQTAVNYWEEDLQHKICIAIGDATARAIRNRKAEPLIAPFPTQEGVLQLLQQLDLQDARIFLPHSKKARPLLETQISCYVLNLYDTLFQKLEPIPDLNTIEEIIFTSPSTVEGFLRIYGKLPRDKKLTAIGPITEEALKR